MKLEFSGQIFEMSWNIKFHESPVYGSQLVSCGESSSGSAETMNPKICFVHNGL